MHTCAHMCGNLIITLRFFYSLLEKRTGKLWEFLRSLLMNSKTCPSLIKWDNYDEGMFKFVQNEKVAQLWGDRKKNENMNYEKFSRAMRFVHVSTDFMLFPCVYTPLHCHLLQILLSKQSVTSCFWQKTCVQIWTECYRLERLQTNFII